MVTEHFTEYAQAYPTKDQQATTVAKVLVETFFIHYGLPVRIHCDEGRNFESRLIHQLCKLLGIREEGGRREEMFLSASFYNAPVGKWLREILIVLVAFISIL